MLRSVDTWASEHFAFGETGVSPAGAPMAIAIDNGADGPSATIPDAHLLFTAQFARAGADLVLHGEDGETFVVSDYFAADTRARLLSPDGAALSPEIVAALAGPLAPGQFAQAAATPPAAQAVGRVAVVSGDATIVRNGVAIAANAGDAVLKGDVLQTVSGTIGVTFSDGSTLNLTANTRLVVNEFVYDPRGSANSQLLDLVQGSLTFISGEIAHNGDMKIGTPVATMGIRGTVGGVTTANDGTVNFYVSQSTTGAVILDSRGTIIANVVQDGPLIIVRPAGPLQVIAEEVQKSPAQLATELAALQQIVNIQSVGQQIIQQYFQQDPNNQTPNPNPQSTDKPLTQIQIFQTPNSAPPAGDGGTNDAPPPFITTATITTTTPNADGTQTTHVETVTFVPNVAPTLDFFNLAVAEGGIKILSASDYHITDPDSSSFTFSVVNVTGGTFQKWSEGEGANPAHWAGVTEFRSVDIAAGHVRFVHDGSNAAPGFTIRVSDGIAIGQTINGTVAYAAVNDAPELVVSTNSEAGTTIAEGGEFVFGVGGMKSIHVSDGDSETLTVTLTATHGTIRLEPDAASHVNIIGGGSDEAEVTFSGSPDAINAALNGMKFIPAGDYSGEGALLIEINDGTTTVSENVVIDITPVADEPTLSVASDISASAGQPIPLGEITAAVTDSSEILVLKLSGFPDGATFSVGELATSGADAGQWIISNPADIASLPSAGLTMTPPQNYAGEFTIHFVAVVTDSAELSNGPATDTQTFEQDMAVSVVAGNEAPEALPACASVSEEGLNGGIPDSSGCPDTTNSVTASGTICATDADNDPLTFRLSEPNASLCSNGRPVIWEIDEAGTLTGTAGEQTIVTVSIDGQTGDYTVTLSGPIDHIDGGVEDVKSFCIPVTVSDGELETCTTLTVKIEDDSPKAVDRSTTVTAGAASASVNIVIILDISGSMNGEVSEGLSRLQLAQDALHNLLTTTDPNINQVMTVTFGSNANTHSDGESVWTSAFNADAYIQTLESATGGGTNYIAALNETMGQWEGDLPSGADRTLVYFISDGEPVNGAVGASLQGAWEAFLALNNVDASYAIGIGTNVVTSLDPISWAAPNSGDFPPIILSDANDLDATLQGTVENVDVHNIFSDGETTVSTFGADRGHILSVEVDGTTYTWDGANTITKSDGEVSSTLTGKEIYVETALGGTFSFFFATGEDHDAGDWTYTPPADAAAFGDEVFHYVLVDNDGDMSGADITVTVENAAPTVDLDSASSGNGYVTSVRPDDTLISVFGENVAIAAGITGLIVGASVRLNYQDGGSHYFDYVTSDETLSLAAVAGLVYDPDMQTYTLNGFSGLSWSLQSGSSGQVLNISGEADAATYNQLLEAVRFSTHSEYLIDRIVTVDLDNGENVSNTATATIHLDSASPGELVGNGSFEHFLEYDTLTIGNWIVGGDTDDETFAIDGVETGSPLIGDYNVLLGGIESDVTLRQDISTAEGAGYTLSFWLMNDGDLDNGFTVQWNGETLLSLVDTYSDEGYVHYIYDVVGADADHSTLAFAAFNPFAWWYLDNVSVREGTSAALQEVASGSVYFTESSPDDTQSVTATQRDGDAFHFGTFTVNIANEPNGETPGSVAWHFSMSNAEYAELGGEPVTQHYDVTITDNNENSTSEVVTVSIGGPGDDSFTFARDEAVGANTIVNFNKTADTIDFFGFDFEDLALSSTSHGDAVINLGEIGSIVIAGVTQDYLEQHFDSMVQLHGYT